MGFDDMNSPFAVYAVKRPVKHSWAFDRTTYLPNGGVSTEVVQVGRLTALEAKLLRATYAAPGVVCGVLYKV